MKVTKNELLQMAANARTTFLQCTGHNKAEMNKRKYAGYRQQLHDLKIELPDIEERDNPKLPDGIFNGHGSY